MKSCRSFQGASLLMDRFAAGDTKVFGVFYQHFFPWAFDLASQLVTVPEDAEDITSDVFAELWLRRTEFTDVDKLSSFMETAVLDACFNFLKIKKLRNQMQKELSFWLFFLSNVETDQPILRFLVDTLIPKEVPRMPRKMRQVFMLYYKQGLPLLTIAQEMHLNIQTISNHKTKAIHFLRLALKQPFYKSAF